MSPAPTNKTSASKIAFDWSKDPTFVFPELDSTTVNLALASDKDSLTSIFYIGKDSKLHQIAKGKDGWEVAKDPGKKQWPEADDKSPRLALVAPPEANELWIFYRKGGDVMQLHLDDFGTWADAIKVATVNENAPTDSKGGSDGDEKEKDGSGSSNSNNDDEASEGLSTGAKAGIGVGAGLGALAVAGAIFMVLRRRRRASNTEDTEQDNTRPTEVHQVGYRAVETDKPVELPIDQGPHELPVNAQEYELLGDVEHPRRESRTDDMDGGVNAFEEQQRSESRRREDRDGGDNA
ncbi:hypothetical protein ACHAPT_006155 [Fusarium lateritium]